MERIQLHQGVYATGAGFFVTGGLAVLSASTSQPGILILGLAAIYIGYWLFLWGIKIDGDHWPHVLCRRLKWFGASMVVAIATIPIFVSAWLYWPRPYLVAYQLCYAHHPVFSANREPTVDQFTLAIRLLNGNKDDPVFFGIDEASFSLGGVADDTKITDPPIRVTSDTRNAVVTMPLRFDPPINPSQLSSGQYHVSLRYGRNPELPLPERMEIKGRLTVTFTDDARRPVVFFTLATDSDPRVIHKDCWIRAKEDSR